MLKHQQTLPANIRLGWRWAKVENTLAYCAKKIGPCCSNINNRRNSAASTVHRRSTNGPPMGRSPATVAATSDWTAAPSGDVTDGFRKRSLRRNNLGGGEMLSRYTGDEKWRGAPLSRIRKAVSRRKLRREDSQQRRNLKKNQNLKKFFLLNHFWLKKTKERKKK